MLFLRSDTSLVAYLGSFAARSNRSVTPQSAETTITVLPSCCSIILAMSSMSEESRKHEPQICELLHHSE